MSSSINRVLFVTVFDPNDAHKYEASQDVVEGPVLLPKYQNLDEDVDEIDLLSETDFSSDDSSSDDSDDNSLASFIVSDDDDDENKENVEDVKSLERSRKRKAEKKKAERRRRLEKQQKRKSDKKEKKKKKKSLQQQREGERQFKSGILTQKEDEAKKKAIAQTLAYHELSGGGPRKWVDELEKKKEGEKKKDREDEAVIYLSRPANNRPLVRQRIVLSPTWSVATHAVVFAKGSAQGTFEVVNFERQPKEGGPASKPFMFNVPMAQLPHLIEAVEKAVTAIQARRDHVITEAELWAKIKKDGGPDDPVDMHRMKLERNNNVAFTTIKFNSFAVRVEDIQLPGYKANSSFEAISISRKVDPDKVGPKGITEFNIGIPISLGPSLLTALKCLAKLNTPDDDGSDVGEA